ncbi:MULTISPECIES: NUDIX hydrolase [unclassified Acinetobacter]|uniref:NUDIX hydrolase n=1 Tax=unclassified Acinetobacter TaxID=196816 RepID=UPI0035B9B344
MTTWQAHVTVATIIEQDGKFLMVEEYGKEVGRNVLNQPAGHVEAGESIQEAAIRETLEETSYRVELTDLLGIYTYTPPMDLSRTYYRFCYIAKVVEKTDLPLDSDIIRTHWMSFAELEQSIDLRSPLILHCIRDYLSGKRLPLDLIDERFLHPKPLMIRV